MTIRIGNIAAENDCRRNSLPSCIWLGDHAEAALQGCTRTLEALLHRFTDSIQHQTLVTLACHPCTWMVAQSLKTGLRERLGDAGQNIWTQCRLQLRLSLTGMNDQALVTSSQSLLSCLIAVVAVAIVALPAGHWSPA